MDRSCRDVGRRGEPRRRRGGSSPGRIHDRRWGGEGRGSAARAKALADDLREVAAAAHSSADAVETGATLLERLRVGVDSGGLKLRSAAPRAETNGRISNYVPDFCGQLDYLLYEGAVS